MTHEDDAILLRLCTDTRAALYTMFLAFLYYAPSTLSRRLPLPDLESKTFTLTDLGERGRQESGRRQEENAEVPEKADGIANNRRERGEMWRACRCRRADQPRGDRARLRKLALSGNAKRVFVTHSRRLVRGRL